MSIASYRDELPAMTDEGWIYLDNCSAGPIPERGLEARRTCERVWIEAGNPGEEWLETVDEARGRFAELIHAEPKDVAVLSCSTDALSQVASAFDYGDRNESSCRTWSSHRSRSSGRPRSSVAPADGGPNHRIANGSRRPNTRGRSPETACLSAPPTPIRSQGASMDVRAVADAVHDAGGYLFLDAYQSAGVVPIDVSELAVDFLVSGSLKFLCGGPGIAFLYVDPDVAGDLQPASQGWSGVADVFGFKTRDPEPAAGAGRFQTGTPPATAASTASAGLSFVLEYGVHRIRDRVRERIRPAHRRAPVPRPSGSNSK